MLDKCVLSHQLLILTLFSISVAEQEKWKTWSLPFVWIQR